MKTWQLCAILAALTLAARAATAQAATLQDEWWLPAPDGCSLYVAEYGKGDPIVIVHGGWGAEHSYLLSAFDSLRGQRRLIYYDQRGSLRSPRDVYRSGGSVSCPDSLITVNNHVEDLERLRKELHVEQLTLVAHSMGGFLALSYLERYPSRVKGLVLVDPAPLRTPATEEDKALHQAQQRAVNDFIGRPEVEEVRRKEGVPANPQSARDVFHEWRIRFAAANVFHVDRWSQVRGGMAFYNNKAGSAAAKSMPASFDFIEVLRRSGLPVTLIMGDHDIVDLGAKETTRELRGISNVELIILRDAGHNSWIDEPTGFGVAISAALAKYH